MLGDFRGFGITVYRGRKYFPNDEMKPQSEAGEYFPFWRQCDHVFLGVYNDEVADPTH